MPSIGPLELVIILVIILLLFGGSRLAGLGKSTGRALKEFKEETRDLSKKDEEQGSRPAVGGATPTTNANDYGYQQPPQQNVAEPTLDPNRDVRRDA